MKYVKRGGWGGKRHTGPQKCGWCGKLGHHSNAHNGCGAIVYVEGDVTGIVCQTCGPVFAGTIGPEATRAIRLQHLHWKRPKREAGERRQMELSPGRPVYP